MNNIKLITISSTLSFILGGAITALFLLGTGNPQLKEARVLNNEITIEQGKTTVILPKGTTVQLSHYVDGQPYYKLHVVGWPDITAPIEITQKWEYFFIQK